MVTETVKGSIQFKCSIMYEMCLDLYCTCALVGRLRVGLKYELKIQNNRYSPFPFQRGGFGRGRGGGGFGAPQQ